MGLPVTERSDSAAPPRASPSILVRIDAGERQAREEALRGGDGVLTGHGVGDEEDLPRLDGCAHALELRHQLVVDGLAAGGVDEHRVGALGARPRRAPLRTRLTGSAPGDATVHRHARSAARASSSCSMAAGR